MAEAVGHVLGGLFLESVVGENEGVALESHDHHQHQRQHRRQRPTRDGSPASARDIRAPDERRVDDGHGGLVERVEREVERVGDVPALLPQPQQVLEERLEEDD